MKPKRGNPGLFKLQCQIKILLLIDKTRKYISSLITILTVVYDAILAYNIFEYLPVLNLYGDYYGPLYYLFFGYVSQKFVGSFYR